MVVVSSSKKKNAKKIGVLRRARHRRRWHLIAVYRDRDVTADDGDNGIGTANKNHRSNNNNKMIHESSYEMRPCIECGIDGGVRKGCDFSPAPLFPVRCGHRALWKKKTKIKHLLLFPESKRSYEFLIAVFIISFVVCFFSIRITVAVSRIHAKTREFDIVTFAK